MPTLSQFTLCFEVERITQKQVRAVRKHPHLLVLVLLLTTIPWVLHQKEWIFTYYDGGNNVALSFGADKSGMQMIIDGVSCSIDSIISAVDITSSMKLLCFLWTSANGQVAVYSDGSYQAKTCSTSTGHTVPPGGRFRLGGQCHVTEQPPLNGISCYEMKVYQITPDSPLICTLLLRLTAIFTKMMWNQDLCWFMCCVQASTTLTGTSTTCGCGTTP